MTANFSMSNPGSNGAKSAPSGIMQFADQATVDKASAAIATTRITPFALNTERDAPHTLSPLDRIAGLFPVATATPIITNARPVTPTSSNIATLAATPSLNNAARALQGPKLAAPKPDQVLTQGSPKQIFAQAAQRVEAANKLQTAVNKPAENSAPKTASPIARVAAAAGNLALGAVADMALPGASALMAAPALLQGAASLVSASFSADGGSGKSKRAAAAARQVDSWASASPAPVMTPAPKPDLGTIESASMQMRSSGIKLSETGLGQIARSAQITKQDTQRYMRDGVAATVENASKLGSNFNSATYKGGPRLAVPA